MLQVRDLECRRGDACLFSAMSFELQDGQLLHVKGSNGSGKTSLLRIVCGLFLPSEGKVFWAGQDIRENRDDFNRALCYIGHLNGLKDDLTAVENLVTHARLAGITATVERIEDALERVGLMHRAYLPTKVLSQGQKRRVALARLLLGGTKLWVLDEPFTALDVKAVDQLQGVIRAHLAGGGSVLLTTHQDVEISSSSHRDLNLDTWTKSA
jgi:heme exporter protein A